MTIKWTSDDIAAIRLGQPRETFPQLNRFLDYYEAQSAKGLFSIKIEADPRLAFKTSNPEEFYREINAIVGAPDLVDDRPL